MVSHHVPVGSRPRAEGSNCDRGAAADGVQGQSLFVNLAGAFAFVVLQELHRLYIGIFSISVWSDHLMIGLRPAQMGLSAVVATALSKKYKLRVPYIERDLYFVRNKSHLKLGAGPRAGSPSCYCPPRSSCSVPSIHNTNYPSMGMLIQSSKLNITWARITGPRS